MQAVFLSLLDTSGPGIFATDDEGKEQKVAVRNQIPPHASPSFAVSVRCLFK